MKLVILESPYGSPDPAIVDRNVAYARRALRNSLEHGEAPIASHLLYTQPGVLNDGVATERRWGIEAGLAWRRKADGAVFYVDYGYSAGMLSARSLYERESIPCVERKIL
jgi:hypothetical protein